MASHSEDSLFETIWEFLPGILKAFSVVGIIVILFQTIAISGSQEDGYQFAKNFVRDYNVKVGKADSNVKVVYFFDFQCPGCKTNDPVLAEVREKYKDRIQFVYRNFPLSIHTFSKPAARGAQAAALQNPEKYFQFKDEVFAIQNEISSDNIAKAAKKIGIDFEKWDKDRTSSEIIKQVDWDLRDANSTMVPNANGEMLPLTGTPSTVIVKDGKAVETFGSIPASEFGAKLDKYLQ